SHLDYPLPPTLGLLRPGFWRWGRYYHYHRRDSLPLNAPSFPQAELSTLIDHLGRLGAPERARHLSLLGVRTVAALRARLSPRMTLQRGDTARAVRVEQVSFDGRSHLWLALEGDARETVPALARGTATIRRP